MNASTAAALIIAGITVLGAIGSVTLLGFRVGRLVGMVEGHIAASDGDRVRLWASIGALESWAQRHLEVYHGAHRA